MSVPARRTLTLKNAFLEDGKEHNERQLSLDKVFQAPQLETFCLAVPPDILTMHHRRIEQQYIERQMEVVELFCNIRSVF